MRSTLDHAIALQKVEAARQRRLVDGERVLELLQVRLALMPRRVMDVILAAMADHTLNCTLVCFSR